jgi:uncharacterized protein (TIRG00374 family)
MPEATGNASWRGRLFAALKIALGMGLLWLLHRQGLLDPARILSALRNQPLWVGLAVTLHGALFSMLGVRWWLVATRGGIPLRMATSQRLTFVSHFFSTCLPENGAGDLVKGVILSRMGPRFPDVLGTMAFDRVSGMAGLFLNWSLCMAALAWQEPQVRPLLLPILPFSIAAATLLVGSLAATSRLTSLARNVSGRLSGRPLPKRIASASVTMLERMERCAGDPSTVVASLGISMAIQALFVVLALCAARSLSLQIGFLDAGAVLPMAALANSLPLSPGGLGVGESVASVAMSRLGHPPEAGAELMIVVRIAVVVWALFGGLVYAFTSFAPRRGSP